MSRFRPKLTYSNVVASIALFAVLGGGVAWAHGKIGTKDLRNGAVTTPKIKNNAVAASKIRANAVKPKHLSGGSIVAYAHVDQDGNVTRSHKITSANVVEGDNPAIYCFEDLGFGFRGGVANNDINEIQSLGSTASFGRGDPFSNCSDPDASDAKVITTNANGNLTQSGFFVVFYR